MRIGVYPGSFDPATLGHLDIIQRASKLFDKLIIAAMINGEKTSAFTMEEKGRFSQAHDGRSAQCKEVDSFSGLLADYVREKNACAIVKGLRAVSDFEYNFRWRANKKLNADLDTVFLMTDQKYLFLSSTIVRDIARHGGDISEFVSEEVREDILKKLDRTHQ